MPDKCQFFFSFPLLDTKSLPLFHLHRCVGLKSWEEACSRYRDCITRSYHVLLDLKTGPAQQCCVPSPEDDPRWWGAGPKDPDRPHRGDWASSLTTSKGICPAFVPLAPGFVWEYTTKDYFPLQKFLLRLRGVTGCKGKLSRPDSEPLHPHPRVSSTWGRAFRAVTKLLWALDLSTQR